MAIHRFRILLEGALAIILTASLAAGPVVAETQEGRQFDVHIAELLDENGNIHLPDGFSGSIDPSGYEMLGGSGDAPRFVQSASSSTNPWSKREFGVPGCSGAIYALETIEDELFIGGSFQHCGFAKVSNIARFDPVSGEFSALGNGVNADVRALVAIGTDLYVGGWFSQAGGLAAARVARFDTTQTGNAGWSTLGDGVNSNVFALAAADTKLYVGGGFSEAGGVSASRVAVYDTGQSGNSGWSALGGSLNGLVRALAVLGTDVYVGGQFTLAGGEEANRVAKFDTLPGGAGWSALGSGANNTVYALAVVGLDLYVGGAFTQAGGIQAVGIARFDTTDLSGQAWSDLGDNASGVRALAASDSDLYLGGSFGLALYDTSQTGSDGWVLDFTENSIPVRETGLVEALSITATNLYIASPDWSDGVFGGLSLIAEYDRSQAVTEGWSLLGSGLNGEVSALAAIGTDLYVGGRFSQVGDAASRGIAKLDTTQSGISAWSSLGDGVQGSVLALAVKGTDLYVGGNFEIDIGGVSTFHVAMYDTTQVGNAGWSALGDGLNGRVEALAIIGPDLYVGGIFTIAGGLSASSIAKYDTSLSGNAGWSALGDGVFGFVYAMAVNGSELYIGGSLAEAGGAPSSNIAVFDTTQSGNGGWAPLGDGLNSAVTALAIVDSYLYVGGGFDEAGNQPANLIARYDTNLVGNAGWEALGDGVTGQSAFVDSLVAEGADLYVGGRFSLAGASTSLSVARFDTTMSGNAGWYSLVGGIDDSAQAFALVGTDLYVGGELVLAGGNVNYRLARYDTRFIFADGFELTCAPDK